MCVCVSFSLWLYVRGVCLRKAEAGSLSVFVFILRAAITSCSWGPYMGKWAEQRRAGSDWIRSMCVYHIDAVNNEVIYKHTGPVS